MHTDLIVCIWSVMPYLLTYVANCRFCTPFHAERSVPRMKAVLVKSVVVIVPGIASDYKADGRYVNDVDEAL